MLTPQDIQAKEFAKAVFGGYDMSAVDDFLEEVTENYTSLYKENAILKGKLKVLVEKVEEYRSTEDAMRMALLTAQKMSDEMVEESKKKCDEMLENAQKQADTAKQQLSEEFSHEQMKLEAAKIKTAAFVQASRQIIDQYNEFLNKLDSVTQEYGGAQEPSRAAQEEPKRSPEPEPVGASAGSAREVELDETIKEIDSFVADVMDGKAGKQEPGAETGRTDASEAGSQDVDDSPTRRIEWNEEDELTTPRPKFNFDDLKFGTNYSENK
ncbi:MAG: DivIVA domain-containing protein [Oscillospiraceae bacterium]